MRQRGVYEVQSGVKLTAVLNYRTRGDNTTNTVHCVYVFYTKKKGFQGDNVSGN